MQKAKQSLKSFQGSTVDGGDDTTETESVYSGTTTTTTEPPQWPKPAVPQSVPKTKAMLDEEGSPDPETEVGRKVIRNFINEWRPNQLQAILRYHLL